MMDKVDIAQEIYERNGQDAVFEYARNNPSGIRWEHCAPCEIVSPIIGSICIVCGSYVGGA